jgi:hypothetical protein
MATNSIHNMATLIKRYIGWFISSTWQIQNWSPFSRRDPFLVDILSSQARGCSIPFRGHSVINRSSGKYCPIRCYKWSFSSSSSSRSSAQIGVSTLHKPAENRHSAARDRRLRYSNKWRPCDFRQAESGVGSFARRAGGCSIG